MAFPLKTLYFHTMYFIQYKFPKIFFLVYGVNQLTNRESARVLRVKTQRQNFFHSS